MTVPVRASARDWWIAVRRACLAVAAVAFAALSWAAVHDIANAEQDVAAEWAFVGLSVLLCGCALMG